jgi:lysophosphatidylcholine acyltransferase/lyso-PAF acetyltransferase
LALAPHSSFFDVLGIVYLNFPSVIGRAGSDNVPLFGHLTKLTQPLIVDRENSSSRSIVVKMILNRLNSPLKWPKLAIYTEGTCTNRKVLLQFKPGAFLAGLPVQPVCFVYNTSIDSISWSWKGPSVYMLLWLTLCQFYNTFEIHYMPVYYPNDEEKTNAEVYANNVRIKMAEYLKIPLSDYSFEDVRLMTRIESHNLPFIIGQIKVQKFIKKFGYICFI